MNRKAERFLVRSAVLLLAGVAAANNLTVQNVALSPSGGGKAAVAFDLSWENSWRDAENFDAAWVFVKYSTDGGTRWRHATLSAAGTNPPAFSPGTNNLLEVIVPADKKGALVQRVASGTGSVATTNMQFVWDFAGDGVSVHAQAIVKVMGIEMVYIPRGPFYVGDDLPASGPNGTLTCTYINTGDMSKVYSAGSGTVAAPYYNPAGCGRPGGVTGTFNAGYPNGYNAYYIAKYEMSEAQYTDFLNLLTLEQATSRYPDLKNLLRHAITGEVPTVAMNGTFSTSAPARTAAFRLFQEAWKDAVAYADWVALRPATEMEFEKAGRGPSLPVSGEHAWGSAAAPTTYATVLNGNADNELPGTAAANANYSICTPDGPIRVGAFATNGASRVKSGAGYYGVMELSGNVMDRVISSGAATRTGAAQWPSFSGLHGEGELTRSGLADTSDWPPMNGASPGGQYTCRSGGFEGGGTEIQLSDRRAQTYAYQSGYGGVRLARTAP